MESDEEKKSRAAAAAAPGADAALYDTREVRDLAEKVALYELSDVKVCDLNTDAWFCTDKNFWCTCF